MLIPATPLQKIMARVQAAEIAVGRSLGSTTLLVVTKNQPINKMQQLVAAGHYQFAENYVQEALDKINLLQDLPIEWHYIGRIQSNKTRAIAENFSWVHSIERLSIAQRLSAQRSANLLPLNVCIQLNVSNEPSKGGITSAQLLSLAKSIQVLPNIQLRGLMALPALTENTVQQRQVFAQMQQHFRDLQQAGIMIDTLSMGTSADFEQAISCGATIVRIGRAFFNRLCT